ncbi:hypothetical protein F5H01DRAFT_401911 [Linnemannia elongata]|nr:hypothetical protein F5H01DRAFT_401911 [Linnemannia elongata]
MVSSRWVLSLATAVLLQTVTGQALQPFQPLGNAEMAYASIPDKTLYIQGGFNLNFTNEFYSLDLTQDNWSVSSPPWKNRTAPTIILTPTSRASISNGMTVTKDQKRLVIWAEPGVFWIDFATSFWQSKAMGDATTSATMRYNYRRAATDGDTGLIYIPEGANQGSKMVVLDPETFTMTTVDMPLDLLPNIDAFLEYFPGNKTWASLATNGAGLPRISRHCMVQGYGGRKIVLYGGHEWNQGLQQLRGLIFVLDVPTMTWTQGDPINPLYASADSACTLTGTNFISWGGSQMATNKQVLATPVIFDVEKRKWIGQFQKQAYPPPSSTTSTSPTSPSTSTSSPTSPDSKGSNVAAIAGGCAGAVVMLGLAGFAFWMRQRRKKAAYASVATNGGASDVAGAGSPQAPNMYNSNTQQDYFKKEPESGRGPYGHYQDGYVSSLNVRDPPTVQTIPARSPKQIVDGYHEFPNDNIQRHPQATPDAFY